MASRIDALLARARREIDAGLLPACQVAVGYQGEVVAFETYGEATPESLFHVFSATKPVTASALWQLIAEGSLDVTAPVAEYLPSFGANGKDTVTVEQAMCHLGGFPRGPMGPEDWTTHESRLAKMASWRLTYEPGTRMEYHATSAHWVEAAILETIDGIDFRDAIHRRVIDPLGLPSFRLGVPEGEQDPIVTLSVVGEPATRDELMATLGVPEIDKGEVTDEALLRHNRPDFKAIGIPGGGGVGTAADLALFYQHLIHDPKGLWDPAVLADGTGNVRVTMPDNLHGAPALRTLGVIVAGDDGRSSLRGLGKTVSPRAFGHNGAAGQVAWADPATGVSFGYVTNGIDAHVLRQGRRGVALSSLAALLTTVE